MPRDTGSAARFWGMPRRAEGARHLSFAELADHFRGSVHLLCYRLTGSFEDAVRLTYDTFLTAWRLRYSAPADMQGWLMAMAVRGCIEHARRRRPAPPRPLPPVSCIPRSEVTWLQPYPDRLLPDDVDADTISLPFVIASQTLRPRDRAALVLTDVEGWSLSRVAGALRMPNADVEPLLARTRTTIAARRSPTPPDPNEDQLLDRLQIGYAAGDVGLIDALVDDDVHVTMPPLPFCFEGRAAVVGVLRHVFATANPGGRGLRRTVPTRANRQGAFAVYVRPDPDPEAEFRGHELVVARTEAGRVVELALFEPHLFPVFGLPSDL